MLTMKTLLVCIFCVSYNKFFNVEAQLGDPGEQCYTSAGIKGICTRQTECTSFEGKISYIESSETCKLLSDGTPIICCIDSISETYESRFYNGIRKKDTIGDQCYTSAGIKGIFIPQTECAEFEGKISHTESSETCKLNSDGTPIICCITPYTSNPPGQEIFNSKPAGLVNETYESRFYNGPRKKQKQIYKPSQSKYPNSLHNYQSPSNYDIYYSSLPQKKPASQNYEYQNNDFSNTANSNKNGPYGNYFVNSAQSTHNNDGSIYNYNQQNNYEKTTGSNYYYRPSYNNYPTTGPPKYKTTLTSNYKPPSFNNQIGQMDSSVVFPGQYRPNYSTSRPTTTNKPSYSGSANNQYSTANSNPYIWEQTTTRKVRTPKPTTTVEPSNNFNQKPNRPSFNNEAEKRISERKCEEYSKFVTKTLSALPLAINSPVINKEVEDCYKNAAHLIVGGKKAVLGEFPHMAALGFRSGSIISYNCGGTIISEEYILTAAHCMHSSLGHPEHVRIGDLNLVRSDDGAQPQIFNVSSIIIYPNYKAHQLYHDIALIKLSRRISFNKMLRPACLHVKNEISSERAIATGWGSTNYGEISSDDLLKVELHVFDYNLCNSLYNPDEKLPNGISRSMVCAGDLSGNKDTCQGDSGGPLQIHTQTNKCIYYIVGVTSFGKACGLANSPGIYTRVSDYVPWIENIVWRNSY